MIQNKWRRLGFILLVVSVLAVAGYFYFFNPMQPTAFIPISKLGQDVQSGAVKSISVDGATVNIIYKDGTTAKAIKSAGESGIEKTLANLNVSPDRVAAVDITYEKPSQWTDALAILLGFLPLVFIGVIIFFFMRRAQGGNNQALSFSKSGARSVFQCQTARLPLPMWLGWTKRSRNCKRSSNF